VTTHDEHPQGPRPQGDEAVEVLMTATWTGSELDWSAAAEELDLASVRCEGTLRNPVAMWVVRNGDDVYVRSV
jgi:Uncharacterized protein conserved in bacteria (DUF2255)